MGTERTGEQGNVVVDAARGHNILANIKEALFERRLAKRAKEITEHIQRAEESQRCTSETVNLQFDAPGGRLWRLNHPNN
jgi:hypothetical protein